MKIRFGNVSEEVAKWSGHVTPLLLLLMIAANTMAQSKRATTLEERVNTIVPTYDNSLPLCEAVVHLAYEYQLPTGIEYLDRECVRNPIKVHLQNASVREILVQLTSRLAEYKVSLDNGAVELYSADARSNAANPLNLHLDNFSVVRTETMEASGELFAAVSKKLHPNQPVFQSLAIGSLGPQKITLSLAGATVSQILSSLVAQNGNAIWVARRRSTDSTDVNNLWHVYSLKRAFESVVIGRMKGSFQ